MVAKAWESQQKRLNRIAERENLVDNQEQQGYRLPDTAEDVTHGESCVQQWTDNGRYVKNMLYLYF